MESAQLEKNQWHLEEQTSKVFVFFWGKAFKWVVSMDFLGGFQKVLFSFNNGFLRCSSGHQVVEEVIALNRKASGTRQFALLEPSQKNRQTNQTTYRTRKAPTKTAATPNKNSKNHQTKTNM